MLPPKRVSDSTGLNLLALGDNSRREQIVLVRLLLRHIEATEEAF